MRDPNDPPRDVTGRPLQLRDVDLDTVLEATGIDREQLDRVAAMMASSQRTVVCWAMGLTQHKHAVPTITEITNVLLMRGMIGKPGAGLCPVRGHSNVQGDRTMGINERPRPAFLQALGREFGFRAPEHHGLDTVATIEGMREGQVKVFFALGGNFLSATPDTEATAEALREELERREREAEALAAEAAGLRTAS